MDATTFRRESIRARARATVEPRHADYWRGYRDGLQRMRLGARAISDAEHRLWSRSNLSRDPSHAARGAGYRDGLAVGRGCRAELGGGA
jgi:hypothetical protein